MAIILLTHQKIRGRTAAVTGQRMGIMHNHAWVVYDDAPEDIYAYS